MDTRTCKHCHQEFNLSGKSFSNHVRWCDKNPSRSTKNIAKANNRSIIERFGELKDFPVVCDKCGTGFSVKEREKSHPKKKQYFCSRACSNSRGPMSNQVKDKIRESFLASGHSKKLEMVCEFCNCKFQIKAWRRKQRFCSQKCNSESRRSTDEYLAYKARCRFNFNVWDYPDEFNLQLIYDHGWYSPVNKKNNLGGVSRDHKISVMFGWENGIDPKLISHPANCELMVHTKNISKHKKCSLVVEELSQNISEWDNKYNEP